MSIAGLSGTILSLGAGALDAIAPKPQTPADAAKAKADAAAATQKANLAAIREKGIYAWAQEEKMAALKARIRQQILSEQKTDEASLAKLDPTARASAESAIQAEIARRFTEAMKTAMEDEARTAAKEGKPPKAMIIDIAV
jgi:hypothetical protein